MSQTADGSAPKNHRRRRFLLTGAAFLALFVVVLFVVVQLWEYGNSEEFCSNVCHAVHPEEPDAYADSYHARVKCTECHMGRVGTVEALMLKTSHFRHVPQMLLKNYERPVRAQTLRPANESCERCHYPPAFHGDRVQEIKQFEPDENNTLQTTYLNLKTGGGARDRGLGQGIHWHIENPVEYIAVDDARQDIRWVRTTLPDGRKVEYKDVTKPMTDEENKTAKWYQMDCVSCHNRVGHPFASPDNLLDAALTERRLDPTLPWAKKVMSDTLNAGYPDQAAALEAAHSFAKTYTAEYPAAAARLESVQQAQALADELVPRVVLDKAGITWESFPDNGKHKDFAGCFRCHDGNHVAEDGSSIRLHCNICHSIPVVTTGQARVPQVPAVSVQEPASHQEANFMRDHRFQANESCEACHGPIAFGKDDSSFCANSACHGRSWPKVNLDAAFPHPIKLEGQHAQVWCHQCHAGVKKPAYVCANCHKPPEDHATANCDSCHSPVGWSESVQPVVAKSPAIPHPLAGRDNCLACHDPSGKVKPAPADHAGRPIAMCLLCHQALPTSGTITPEASAPMTATVTAGAATAATVVTSTPPAAPLAAPAIPHALTGRDNCLACHDPAGQIKPAPADHAGRTIETCAGCHTAAEAAPTASHVPEAKATVAVTPTILAPVGETPQGSPAATGAGGTPSIPHALADRDNCLACHDPGGKIKPAPADHAGRSNAICLTCHRPPSQT